MSQLNTRNRIIEAADALFYQQGFEHTSFTDIASQVEISRGNFYHHFKTKDDILDAVIQHRMELTETMLEDWESHNETPLDKILAFINILIRNQSKIMQYGCPVGTLCSELTKLDHPAQSGANQIFDLFRTWLNQRFIELGHPEDADKLALHVLAFSQGVATLASTYQQPSMIEQEIELFTQWLTLRLKPSN